MSNNDDRPSGGMFEVEDAIRAVKDRPSMEAELTALLDEHLRLVERKQELVARCEELEKDLGRYMLALNGCNERCWRYEAALRGFACLDLSDEEIGELCEECRGTIYASRAALDDGRGE